MIRTLAQELHTYMVRAWKRREAHETRYAYAEVVVKATNGWDAALLAAEDLGLNRSDWDDGSKSPDIVLRVESYINRGEP